MNADATGPVGWSSTSGGMANTAAKANTKANSFYRNAFALTLLAAVLCSALMSWSSSRTLSFSLSGTWRSSDGEELVATCEGGSAWSSTCSLRSTHTQFDGVVKASPLSGGGWVAILETDSSNALALWRSGRALTIVTERESSENKGITYIRDKVLAGDFVSAVRTKGKYIAALFLVVGTYKWVQVSLFGAPARRVRRF